MSVNQLSSVSSTISVCGSADLICDYLNYGINSILYQRGLYPPAEFQYMEQYGITLLMTTNVKIQEFINNSMVQLKDWLMERCVNRVALVVINVATGDVMERWDFTVDYHGENPTSSCISPNHTNSNDNTNGSASTSIEQIRKEIRDVLKQIIASVSFLPLLDCRCCFDIHVYTHNGVKLPANWGDTKSANVVNAQSMQIRSFDTNIHRMGTIVTYKHFD